MDTKLVNVVLKGFASEAEARAAYLDDRRNRAGAGRAVSIVRMDYAKTAESLSVAALIHRLQIIGPIQGMELVRSLAEMLRLNPQLRKQLSTRDLAALQAMGLRQYAEDGQPQHYAMSSDGFYHGPVGPAGWTYAGVGPKGGKRWAAPVKAAAAQPAAPAKAPAAAPAQSNNTHQAVHDTVKDLADHLGNENGVPIPAVFHKLKAKGLVTSTDGFHAVLREMEKAGQISLKTTATEREMTEPDKGIREDGKTLYLIGPPEKKADSKPSESPGKPSESDNKPSEQPADKPGKAEPMTPEKLAKEAAGSIYQATQTRHQDGIGKLADAYRWMKQEVPDLTPAEFKGLMQGLWANRVIEGKVLNEVAQATPEDRALALDGSDDGLRTMFTIRDHEALEKGVAKFLGNRGRDFAAEYKTHGTKAPAFKAWFGDWENDPSAASQVRNEKGPTENYEGPAIMYHGTGAGGFTEFDPTKARYGTSGKGFYFTEDKGTAEWYAKKGMKPEVKACYLNIRNPLVDEPSRDLNSAGHRAMTALLAKHGKPDDSAEVTEFGITPFMRLESAFREKDRDASREKVMSVLKSAGFDGLRCTTMIAGKPQKVWIAFEPNQIKSVENRGTFDPSEDRMDYAKDQPTHYAMSPDGFYHGPQGPQGWTYAGIGPKGGKRWAAPAHTAAQQPVAAPARAPAQPAPPAPARQPAQPEAAHQESGQNGTGKHPDARVQAALEQEAAEDYKQNGTKAKAFKSWFGDWEDAGARAKGLVSKVIDYLTGAPRETAHVAPSKVTGADGKPITVYHGTQANFDSFDPAKQNESAIYGPGFYFSEDLEVAEQYSEGNALRAAPAGDEKKAKRTIKAFLNIKAPFDADWHLSQLATNPGAAKFGYEFLASATGGNKQATEKLKKLGYDGVTHTSDKTGGGKFRVWIAFQGNQIKSVENRGTFDPTNDRIDYEREKIMSTEQPTKMAPAFAALFAPRVPDQPAHYEMAPDGYYHGPQGPAGWTYVGVGPKGGKRWAAPKGQAAPKPAAAAPKPAAPAPAAPKPAPKDEKPALSHKDYHDQAMGNLEGTSRTAKGVVDTSASPGKAAKMAEGLTPDLAKAAAKGNFEKVIKTLHEHKDATFSSPQTLMDFVDSVAALVNEGITKPDALHRTDDAPKLPYTAAADLPHARQHFAKELFERLQENADPIDTAGWIEWRLNLTDHLYSDGVGKTSKALGAWALMRGGLPLPKYRENSELFANANRKKYDPKSGPEPYQGEEYDKWQAYYRSLFRCDVQAAVRHVEQTYKPVNAKGADTYDRHQGGKYDPEKRAYVPDGQWSPERLKLHQGIVEAVRAGVPAAPPGEKTYTMMGGGPASGKSSVLRERAPAGGITLGGQAYQAGQPIEDDHLKLASPEERARLTRLTSLPKDHVMIDVDSIKGKLPEYAALVADKDDRAASYAHEESSHLGKIVQNESLQAGQHTVLDGTGDNAVESVEKKINQARQAGFKIHAHYVTCSTEEAVRRNEERAKQTGRKPAEDMLRSVHKGVSNVLPALVMRGSFDNVDLYDSEHETDGRPTLVMSAQGKAMTVHHPELWTKFLAKGQETAPKMKAKPTYYAREMAPAFASLFAPTHYAKHDVSGEKRDDEGRWTGGANPLSPGAGKAKKTLESHLGHLPTKKRAEIRKAAHLVLDAMPEEAIKRLNENLDGYVLFKNLVDLNKHIYPDLPTSFIKKAIANGKGKLGYYDRHTKEIVMDGRENGHSAQEVFAHEVGHAVDGPSYSVTTQGRHGKAWRLIWERELKKKNPASDVSDSPHEGLAHIFKLWYGGRFSRDEVRKEYPATCSFLMGAGLL